jgi:hypothetical protein
MGVDRLRYEPYDIEGGIHMVIVVRPLPKDQVPLSALDQAAFVRYMEAMSKHEDSLPTDFAALSKLISEAEHQAWLFFVCMRTWDFSHEARIYYLRQVRDQLLLSKAQQYR